MSMNRAVIWRCTSEGAGLLDGLLQGGQLLGGEGLVSERNCAGAAEISLQRLRQLP
jgi:hypothetical protein